MVQGFPTKCQLSIVIPQLKGAPLWKSQLIKALTLVVDGYSAPVTAGNFVDLVQRGFYNGLEFIGRKTLMCCRPEIQ